LNNDKVIALTATSERPASTSSGYALLVVLVIAVLADIYGVNQLGTYDGSVLGLVIVAIATLTFIVIMPGFFMLQPNQAAAITLFGAYQGTDRTTGLRWTWPRHAK
jgi:regulator of protease activity HflC (stomatin/prohibitin superfamily)